MRSHLLRKLLRRSFQIRAGHHHRHLRLRNRTCRWLTFPRLRRSSSQQALSPTPWSPAAPRLPSLQLLACPNRLRRLRRLHLQLALCQNLWPSSLRRTRWARTVALPGRTLAHLWSHPRSCRWSGFALWRLSQGFRLLLRVHQPLRSLCEEPCLGGPARCLLPPLASMLLSGSRPPAWLPVRILEVLCPLEHQRPSLGRHSLLPPRPALFSPRARKNCSLRGPCPLRPRPTSSGIWWLNFGAFQSCGHPRPRRSLPRPPHPWPANPLWESLLPPPVFPGRSLLLRHPPMGSLTLRTGLRESWLLQRRWLPLVQVLWALHNPFSEAHHSEHVLGSIKRFWF